MEYSTNENKLKIDDISAFIKAEIASMLRVDEEQIDSKERFDNFGLASADAFMLMGKLEKKVGKRLSPLLIWTYDTIDSLTSYLDKEVLNKG